MLSPRRCAVVGHPVGHSLSPAMHRAAYAALGLDWTYEALDVAPGALGELVGHLDGTWRGLSVTAPHKRDALDLADVVDDVAGTVGGANTLLREGDASLHAHNTDVPGAAAALREAGVDGVGTVRVLGAGATAASVAVAVAGLGARRLELLVRDPERAGPTRAVATAAGLEVDVRSIDAPYVDAVDLVVSTVPASAVAARSREVVAAGAAVFDVVYDPWPTPLVTAGRAAGRPTVSGLDLLAHQAVLQVRLMTGGDVAAGLLRDAALAALEA